MFHYSFKEAWHSTANLRELDPVLTKVMLYMCPHKERAWVFEQTDPVLSECFLVWRANSNADELVKEAKVGACVSIYDHISFVNNIFFPIVDVKGSTASSAKCSNGSGSHWYEQL